MQSTIVSVRKYMKNKPMLAIQTTSGDVVHVSQKQWLNENGNLTNLIQYNGCTLNYSFYKEGEDLLDGSKCTKSGVILKDFSLQLSMQAQIAMTIADTFAAQFMGTSQSSTNSSTSANTVEVEEEVEVEETSDIE